MTRLLIAMCAVAVVAAIAVSADAKEQGCGEAAGLKYGEKYTPGQCPEPVTPVWVTPYPTMPAVRPMSSGSNKLIVRQEDTDLDGCPDKKELSGTATSGGLRDPLNHWDYFNPSHDGLNRVDDIFLVVNAYFNDQGSAGYSDEYDRTQIPGSEWASGPPNGQMRVDDILAIQNQYFHDCWVGEEVVDAMDYCDGNIETASGAASKHDDITADITGLLSALPDTSKEQAGAAGALETMAVVEPSLVLPGEEAERCVLIQDGDTNLGIVKQRIVAEAPGGAAGPDPLLTYHTCSVSVVMETGAPLAALTETADWAYISADNPFYGYMDEGEATKHNTLPVYEDVTFASIANDPPLTEEWYTNDPFWMLAQAETTFGHGPLQVTLELSMVYGMGTCLVW